MLNNLTNFFNLITSKMIKKTPEATDLMPLGTRDGKYGGKYKPTAISYADFVDSLPFIETVTDNNNTVVRVNNTDPKNPVVGFFGVYTDNSTITGDGTENNPLVASGGGPVIDENGNVIVDDSSNDTVSIPDGVLPVDFVQTIPNFSGSLIVNDHYDGGVEMWLCGGGSCILLNATTASNGGGLMTMNGGANGYDWANAQALSGPFTFTVVKTRQGS